MKMHNNFKNPGEDSEKEEDLEDIVDESIMDDGGWLSDSDLEDEDLMVGVGHETDDSFVFGSNESESDSSMDDSSDLDEQNEDQKDVGISEVDDPGTSKTVGGINEEASGSTKGNGNSNGAILELNEEDENDDTVRAMISAIKKPRTSPPEIKLDDFITDICFHPELDLIALATITGDVALYQYNNDGNKLLRTIEVHAKACRDVEFTEHGRELLTCSKDKSIMVTDMTTEKLKKFYESAHEDAINKLTVIDENLFVTGDDSGTVKLWDLRTKNEVFALKEVEDYITEMLTNDDKKLLLVTSGDGYLTTLNLSARKLYVQSEPYEEEFNCMGLFRNNSKLVVGTSKGRLYSYNWGQFAYHCDMYPGIMTPIDKMIPITDRIACVAGDDGIIRSCHIAPFRNLGIVGQHTMAIESLDINHTGEIIASSSHNNEVRFWNVKFFEDFGDIKYNEKHNAYKDKQHNLPSSKFPNVSDFFAGLDQANSDDD